MLKRTNKMLIVCFSQKCFYAVVLTCLVPRTLLFDKKTFEKEQSSIIFSSQSLRKAYVCIRLWVHGFLQMSCNYKMSGINWLFMPQWTSFKGKVIFFLALQKIKWKNNNLSMDFMTKRCLVVKEFMSESVAYF